MRGCSEAGVVLGCSGEILFGMENKGPATAVLREKNSQHKTFQTSQYLCRVYVHAKDTALVLKEGTLFICPCS